MTIHDPVTRGDGNVRVGFQRRGLDAQTELAHLMVTDRANQQYAMTRSYRFGYDGRITPR